MDMASGRNSVSIIGKILLATFALGAATSAPGVVHAAVEIAKVNGKPVTEVEFYGALGGMSDVQRKSLLADPSVRREIVTQLVDQEILIQEGEKAKLEQEADYQKALKMFRRQYLANKVLERAVVSKVTDASAKSFYEDNKLRYSTDKARVQHILVATEAEARDVLKAVKEKDADFQEIAEKRSKDPSAKNNRGEVGLVTRDAPFDEEFKTAVFRTKAGEITGPVKTMFGYHVIKVVERTVGRTLDYSEVEMRVKNDLRSKLVKDFVLKLRGTAQVSIDDKAVEKL